MIFIGADHRGFKQKEELIKFFTENLIEHFDCGNTEYNSEDDFPIFAFAVTKQVLTSGNSFIESKNGDWGLLICGSGEGMSIAANKAKGIRAALCSDIESAKQSRQENNCNVLVLNEKHGLQDILDIINAFRYTDFSADEKYARRVGMIEEYENL